ncbi:MAG: ATP-binding cassette domain-containing protein [Anaerolineae bacterium]|nr:ATP-binding cassette domain-containing protein [Anaerolineae bacterium]
MNIELRQIHKRFGSVHANNDISVTFAAGRIVGILGENGAGKSTLMKILSGYQPADSGEILIGGQRVDYSGPQAAIAHGIGMLQQDPLDVGAFSVLENFTYGQPGGLTFNRRDAEWRLNQLCQRFGFDLPANTPVEMLSIAQRQQLEIVRLLALGVRVLILDEPTTGISADQKQQLFNVLRALAQEMQAIILLVSHKLEDVIALCDEVIVLRAGQLVGAQQMPATTSELVSLMFGGQLPPQARIQSHLGDVVLRLENAHLSDRRLAMRDVNFQVRAGEVVGLAGLDGSGQRPFMRACAGLDKLLSGRVMVKDEAMTGRPYRDFLAHKVVFGAAGRLEEGLIAGLTLTDHIALATTPGWAVDWAEAERYTNARIEQYHVRGRATDNIEQLSGGNQQRVLMALLPEDPVALVLEQPTRGLDVESARWIWQQLLARRDKGSAIIFSSAELEELVTYSDRILVFYAGQIYEVPDVTRTSVDELGHLIGGAFMQAT